MRMTASWCGMIEMSSRSSHTEYKVVARWSPRHGRLASDCFVRAALMKMNPKADQMELYE